jgi:dolichol-phosphate mannosyltransferase
MMYQEKAYREYSIVVPVFNERDNLIPLRDNIVEAMSSISDDYEVILVDDGSTDGSRDFIRNICAGNPQFRFVFFDGNYGQSAAFDAGFKAAVGDAVITMDADLQVSAHDIPLLLKQLGPYDVVIGYREKRSDNWLKRISSRIANGVRNWLTDENIRDVGCPLKVIKRKALQNLKLYQGMHRFFPTLLKLEGYTVYEVPIHHYPRIHGQSKYNVRNRVFRALHDLFAVRWIQSRILRYRIVEEKK